MFGVTDPRARGHVLNCPSGYCFGGTHTVFMGQKALYNVGTYLNVSMWADFATMGRVQNGKSSLVEYQDYTTRDAGRVRASS